MSYLYEAQVKVSNGGDVVELTRFPIESTYADSPLEQAARALEDMARDLRALDADRKSVSGSESSPPAVGSPPPMQPGDFVIPRGIACTHCGADVADCASS